MRSFRILPCLLLTLACFGIAGCHPSRHSCAGVTGMDLQSSIQFARDRVEPALVQVIVRQDEYQDGRRIETGGTGSGTIFNAEGYVLTNFHVAGEAKRVKLLLHNNELVKADLVGADPWTDLAIVRIRPEEIERLNLTLQWAELGDSSRVEVGDVVLAMGAPYGLSKTITQGIISNNDRVLGEGMRLPGGHVTGSFNNWFQTDAAINPGNSGGPLVNLRGEVIGVNSRGNMGANNLGYAVPIDIAREVIAQIMATGKVTRSWLGIDIQNMQDLESFFDMDRFEGALVSAVEPESPAARAGLRAQDILLSCNGQTVSARYLNDIARFNKLIADLPVGADVRLQARRGQQAVDLTMKTEELRDTVGQNFVIEDWGLSLQVVTDAWAQQIRLQEPSRTGVTGVEPGKPAQTGGLQPGDVIVAVNGEAVTTVEAFLEMIRHHAAGGTKDYLVTVFRGRGLNYALVKTK